MFSLVKRVISILLLSTTFFTFSFWPAFAATTYTYDANGNMTSDGVNCYTYNDDNDLTQARNCTSGQLIGEYTYDDQGNRIIQKIYQNGVLSQTVYTPTKSFEATKIASNGQFQNTSYYILDGQILARKNSDGTKTFYHNDTLGSATLLTNQAGQLVENTTYYPFGGIKTGGTQSKFLYTGQKRDSETGLDYYNARYYNDQIARFTQPDTFVQDIYNPQDLNEYSYVLNNPLKYIDPTGHWSISSLFSSIASIFSNSAPKPASTYTLPSNSIFTNTKVNLANTSGTLPTAYTKESPITNYINKSLNEGSIQGEVGASLGGFGASAGMKFNNQGQAQYGSGGVGVSKFSTRFGGSIVFSQDHVKQGFTLNPHANFDFLIAVHLGYDPKNPKKLQVEGLGVGCCGVDIGGDVEYTGKTYDYAPPVPNFTSKKLEDFYEK